MAVVYSEGDDVFYRGAQFPWGHAVVVHVSDAGYVLDLDHCGEVVVGLDEVTGLDQPTIPAQSSTANTAQPTATTAAARTSQSDKP